MAFSLTDFVRCGFATSFFNRASSAACDSFFCFFPTLSATKDFRVACGSFRGPPATRTHRFPVATPHVGQRTEEICLCVSCLISFLHVSLDGHRTVLQELDELRLVYLQASVIADQTLLLEIVHEFAYPRARGTDHFRQG